ncbi:MAG: hypothetical protein C0501_00275 [Isosphaera sp.]|nr:hypothetical protein [Isosphaera sp.]
MIRPSSAALVLLAWPAAAPAQPQTLPLTTAPEIGFNGLSRMSNPGPFAPTVSALTPFPSRVGGGVVGKPYVGGVGGGLGFPFAGVWTGGYGFGGLYFNGYYPNYRYGFGYPTTLYAYPVPVPVVVPVPEPVPARPRSSEPLVPLANEFPAVVTLEFPGPAEVWLNDKKQPGEPTAEWRFTSPAIPAGSEYTFEVKARWKSGGKTYEYVRSVPAVGGQQKGVLVVSGTEVR